MFQQEFNGYKKSEVDAFIQSMKASYESKLMTEKFKVLDAEKKLLEVTTKQQEIEDKEQNIINVIEKQKKYQEEGSKKIYGLLIDKLDFIINELELRFPQFKRDREYAALIDELASTISSYKEKIEKTNAITHPVNSENDSMRVLLNKMQNYKKKENSLEMAPKKEEKAYTKSLYEDFDDDFDEDFDDDFEEELEEELEEDEETTTLKIPKPSKYDDKQKAFERIYEYMKKEDDFDSASPLFKTKPKFYDYEDTPKKDRVVITPDKQPEKKRDFAYVSPLAIPPSESGFSFQEALNPKEDLEEIMKAFDFYNDETN